MIQVKRCSICLRFQNSMGFWIEIDMESDRGMLEMVTIASDPNIEIVRTVCPDCSPVVKQVAKTRSG
jgi:hypothetical protein